MASHRVELLLLLHQVHVFVLVVTSAVGVVCLLHVHLLFTVQAARLHAGKRSALSNVREASVSRFLQEIYRMYSVVLLNAAS